MAVSKIKALQAWCKNRTEGYKDVDIRDMTKSFRNGLAFCAIIHRFRPDLIDFHSLSKENVLENNKLAFEVAEKELGICALLDASDMVLLAVPDKLSIITYVSQYHNYFKDLPQNGGPAVKAHAQKRHKETPTNQTSAKHFKSNQLTQNTGTNRQVKVQADENKVATLGDKCALCDGKVYLLERHIESGKLYHRSCYKHSDLSPTSKVFKDKNVDNKSSQEDKFKKLDKNIVTEREKKTSSRALFTGAENNKKGGAVSDSSVSTNKLQKYTAHPISSTNIETSDRKEKNVFIRQKHMDDVRKTEDTNSHLKKHSKNTESVSMEITRKPDHPTSGLIKNVPSKNEVPNSYRKDDKIVLSSESGNTHKFNSPFTVSSQSSSRPKNLPLIFSEKINEPEKDPSPQPRSPFNARPLKKTEPVTKVISEHETPKPAVRTFIKNKDQISNVRPKTPPFKHKAVVVDVDISTSSPEDQIPPPLPRSAPPLNKRTFSPQVSPLNSPKFSVPDQKNEKSDVSEKFSSVEKTSVVSPTKPPRAFNAHSRIASPSATNNEQREKFKKPETSQISTPSATNLSSGDSKNKPQIFQISSPSATHYHLPGESKNKPTTSWISSPHATNYQPPGKSKNNPTISQISSPTATHFELPGESKKKSTTSQISSPNATHNQPPGESKNKPITLRVASPSRTDLKSPRDAISKPNASAKSEDGKDVLSGLLKSLAGVRERDKTNHESTTNKSNSQFTETKSTSSPDVNNLRNKYSSPEINPKFNKNSSTDVKTDYARNKQNKNLLRTENMNENIRLESKTQQNKIGSVDHVKQDTKEDIPSWKEAIQKRKMNDKPNKTSDSTQSPKLDWQLEAEKRQFARKDKYTDKLKGLENKEIPKESDLINNNINNLKNKHDAGSRYIDESASINKADTSKGHGLSNQHKVNNVTSSSNITGQNKNTFSESPTVRKKISPPKIDFSTPKQKNEFAKKIKYEPCPDLENGNPSKTSPVKANYRTPERPPPPQTHKKRLTPQDLQRELREIDAKLTSLELKGRNLEDSIRYAVTAEEEDDLLGRWFTLINDKNELVRKEADIMYISREQELEDKQEEVSGELRVMMEIPEHHKSPDDKEKEELLMKRLLNVVNQRNRIVDTIDADRLRYEAEDAEIAELIRMKAFSQNASAEKKVKSNEKKHKK